MAMVCCSGTCSCVASAHIACSFIAPFTIGALTPPVRFPLETNSNCKDKLKKKKKKRKKAERSFCKRGSYGLFFFFSLSVWFILVPYWRRPRRCAARQRP